MSMFNISENDYEFLIKEGIEPKYSDNNISIIYPESENLYKGWHSSNNISLLSLKNAIRNYNISKL